jgi:hypothetical protein
MVRHSERCTQCKANVARLLERIYGEAFTGHFLGLPTALADYKAYTFFGPLARIHQALQDYRGHHSFARAVQLPAVDYYVPRPGLVVEFDESQHFTRARLISLIYYPSSLSLGYDRDRWMDLARQLDRHDNDPAYRDEQRAWYDTLRDFSALALGNQPTVRLYAADAQWCALDAGKSEDVDRFRRYLASGTK